jgi:hypothetical protein
MVHPVDPANTATSVAATAPAFSIRRLALFAFIGPFIGVPSLLVFKTAVQLDGIAVTVSCILEDWMD